MLREVSGDFETHLTVRAHPEVTAQEMAVAGARLGLKFIDIVLDRGRVPRQPMFTGRGSGTLSRQLEAAQAWRGELAGLGLEVIRVKVEAAPWSAGIPQTDEDARAEPADRYFEHHLKLLVGGDECDALAAIAMPHRAHLSRNARRMRAGGVQERFVTQRCHRVRQATAPRQARGPAASPCRSRLSRRGGRGGIRGVRQRPVDRYRMDRGRAVTQDWDNRSRKYRRRTTAKAGQGAAGFPATYAPVSRRRGVRQNGVFDPALRQFRNAYRAGRPLFDDERLGLRWGQTQLRVMDHVLAAVADSAAGRQLVLRGSRLMHAWFGAEARAPGDLDWVVVPPTIMLGEATGTNLLGGVLRAIAAVSDVDGATRIDPTRVAMEDLWTYERAPGRRIVLPWTSTGLPAGVVQMDFVFNEQLPQPAIRTELRSTLDRPIHVMAAGPELSLAWKLLWLETDAYPQGKDLYDAVLLAERFTAPHDLIHHVLSKELGAAAADFHPDSVLAWDVDWGNLIDEYPHIGGTAQEWQQRLAQALRATFANSR